MGIVAAYVVPHPPLIIPQVGRGSQDAIQATINSYEEVARRIADHAPDTIIVASPHAPLYRDTFYIDAPERFHGDMSAFRAPEAALEVRGHTALGELVAKRANEAGIEAYFDKRSSGELDHGTFIPLYFVRDMLSQVRVVRIGLSGLPASDHRALGRIVAQAVDELGESAVFIASGDMSHKLKHDGPYGFDPRGPQFDGQVVELFAAGDLDGLFALDVSMCRGAAECGLGSFRIMAGALDEACARQKARCKAQSLSYEGPYGVGYAVATFEVEPADSAVDPYVALARESVEHFVRTGTPLPVPAEVPAELLERRAGVFVSLHAHGGLRGCMGTISPVFACVAEEIVANGVSAASRDPRFRPVQEYELDALSYSVDVLGAPEPVSSTDQLDPKRYGVIVTKGARRGLLLPDLEGVDTVDVQVAIAKRKAGIDPRDDEVSLQRFEVVRHDRGGEARER